MGDLLKILFGGIIGFGIAKAIGGDTEEKSAEDFYVYVRTEEAGKVSMYFKDYLSAKNVFQKIKTTGKVKYSDLLKNSEGEAKHYAEMIEKKYTKEDGVSSPNDIISVQEVYFGKGNEDWESKTFKN